MVFSEKLQSLRKDKNITQEQIAEVLGISRQSVSKWETGASYPDTQNLIRLAEILGVTVDELSNSKAEIEKNNIVENKSANMLVALSKFWKSS